MNISVKLDTNGSFPEKLKTLLQNDLLDYIALDLKGLSTDDIQYVTRNKNYTLDIFLETLNEIKTYKTFKGETVNFEIRHTLWKAYSADDFSQFLKSSKTKRYPLEKLPKDNSTKNQYRWKNIRQTI